MSPLQASFAQQDFSAGMVRMAPHLLPPNSAWLLENFLLDETGSPYKRGGTEVFSGGHGAEGLTFLWDGELAGGHRTVLANATALAVLAADDETVVSLGAGGMARPLRPAVLDGIMYVGSYAYAGARGGLAAYSTGTVTVTEGSTTLTGAGTSWTGKYEKGSLLVIGNRVVAVDSVQSNTSLTLALPWTGATAAGQAYVGSALAALPAAYHPGAVFGVVGNRLLAAEGRRIYMTVGGDATTWTADEYHELPEGGLPTAIAGLRDTAFIFTTDGVWTIANVFFDLTDDFGNTQQRLERAASIVLWDPAGLTSWQEGLIVPALDGVWLFGNGDMELVSLSIAPVYDELVRSGAKPGGAVVFKGHLLLPVLTALNNWETTLVCRLDQPVRTRVGVVFPWTTLAGAGAQVRAFAGRFGQGTPLLLAAERGAGSRVIRFPDFTPEGLAADHDASPVLWDFVSRQMATGPLNENMVKKARLRYELINPNGAPTIEADWGSDDLPPATSPWGGFQWGAGFWADGDDVGAGMAPLVGVAPATSGGDPFAWRVNKRLRFFRLRLRPTAGATRTVLRSLELSVRPSGRM